MRAGWKGCNGARTASPRNSTPRRQTSTDHIVGGAWLPHGQAGSSTGDMSVRTPPAIAPGLGARSWSTPIYGFNAGLLSESCTTSARVPVISWCSPPGTAHDASRSPSPRVMSQRHAVCSPLKDRWIGPPPAVQPSASASVIEPVSSSVGPPLGVAKRSVSQPKIHAQASGTSLPGSPAWAANLPTARPSRSPVPSGAGTPRHEPVASQSMQLCHSSLSPCFGVRQLSQEVPNSGSITPRSMVGGLGRATPSHHSSNTLSPKSGDTKPTWMASSSALLSQALQHQDASPRMDAQLSSRPHTRGRPPPFPQTPSERSCPTGASVDIPGAPSETCSAPVLLDSPSGDLVGSAASLLDMCGWAAVPAGSNSPSSARPTSSSLRSTMGLYGPPEPPSEMKTANHEADASETCAVSFVVQNSPFRQKSNETRTRPLQGRSGSETKCLVDKNGGAPCEDKGVMCCLLTTDAHELGDGATQRKNSPDDRQPGTNPGATTVDPYPLQPRARGMPSGAATPTVAMQMDGEVRSSSSERRLRLTDLPSDASTSVAAAAASVNLKDLGELRSFRQPPAVVCQVLETVAVLLGVSDVRWVRMRKLLDKDFIHRLSAFDPASATPAQVERLKVLLRLPTFSDNTIGDRCPAVVALAAWCNAVGRHLEVAPPTTPSSQVPTPVVGRSRRDLAGCGNGRSCRSTDPAQSPDCCMSPSTPRSKPIPRSSSKSEVPDLDGLLVEPDLWSLDQTELARVHELQVSRDGVGAVTFHGITDCRGLVGKRKLSDIVVLNPGEVIVYPNQSMKPPVGSGLNKPASIVLYGCLPKAQVFIDKKARERYKKRVRQMTEDKGAEFIGYDCDEGIWQFRVKHF